MIDFSPLITGSSPKRSILELYPFLMDIKDMDKFNHVDKERVLHYMLLAYHPFSPMIEKFTAISQRKEKSAEYAGYKVAVPKDNNIRAQLFDHTDKEFLTMLNNFLVAVNNRTWSMIVCMETAFQEFQSKVLYPLELGAEKDILAAAKQKAGILQEMSKIDTELDGCYQKMYMHDDKLIAKSTARKSITPESVAGNVHKT